MYSTSKINKKKDVVQLWVVANTVLNPEVHRLSLLAEETFSFQELLQLCTYST